MGKDGSYVDQMDMRRGDFRSVGAAGPSGRALKPFSTRFLHHCPVLRRKVLSRRR
jgi:hypothetical protein